MSVKNDVNVTSKNVKQKNLRKKKFVGIMKVTKGKKQDPDPYQNAKWEHCKNIYMYCRLNETLFY
jgi:hypothetical protein